jgi:hypothetical protein
VRHRSTRTCTYPRRPEVRANLVQFRVACIPKNFVATRIKPHAVPLNYCDCYDHRTELGERLIAASRAGYGKSDKAFFHCAIAPWVNVSGPSIGAGPATEFEARYTLCSLTPCLSGYADSIGLLEGCRVLGRPASPCPPGYAVKLVERIAPELLSWRLCVRLSRIESRPSSNERCRTTAHVIRLALDGFIRKHNSALLSLLHYACPSRTCTSPWTARASRFATCYLANSHRSLAGHELKERPPFRRQRLPKKILRGESRGRLAFKSH